jgi:hypothetical protein
LPSAQSTPNAIAGTGLQPTTPPSSANLVAAGAPNAATGAGTPMASIYPTTGAPPVSAATAVPGTGAPTAASAVAAASANSTAGPYDPGAYRSVAPVASNSTTPAPNVDRYSATPGAGVAAAVTQAPHASSGELQPAAPISPQSSYAAATGAPTTPASIPPTGDRYGILPVAGPVTSPTGAMATNVAPVMNAQVATPAGSYRPAGTSDYVSPATNGHVEIATRPSPATSTPAPVVAPAGTYQQSPYTSAPY